MQYPETTDAKNPKPISEMMYRLIALFFVLVAFAGATIATIIQLPPVPALLDRINLSGDGLEVLIGFGWFFILLVPIGIIMRILRPYSDMPKSPYSGLNFKTFLNGDADQDDYKLND